MNDKEIKKILNEGKAVRVRVDRGLYFRVSKEGTGFWVLRYTVNKITRREMTIGRYGKMADELTLAKARDEAAKLRADINSGIDPLAEKNRADQVAFKTVDALAKEWLLDCRKRLKYPKIPERIYRKEISPIIGKLDVEKVTPLDIKKIIKIIYESGRPTISNDALTYCKQLFNEAKKYNLIEINPATAFSMKDAGGSEESRDRKLTLNEIEIVFKIFRENHLTFTRDNYLAMALLLVFGVRKGELISAKWDDFSFTNMVWHMRPNKTKSNAYVKIPIPEATLPWFKELSIRANGSEYIFPSRRKSKRRGYISDDTLNHSLSKLFGQKPGSKKEELPNLLGNAGIKHFVVHDLRRTCRSLIAENGTLPHVAEKCLNHKLKGVEGIYDHYDYFKERKEALNLHAETVVATLQRASDGKD